MQLQEYGTYSECVDGPDRQAVDAVTTDDIDPRRLRRPAGQYKGKLKLVGKTFSEENYGVGLKKGDTACAPRSTTRIKKMIADGAWAEGRSRQPSARPASSPAPNPPEPDACA